MSLQKLGFDTGGSPKDRGHRQFSVAGGAAGSLGTIQAIYEVTGIDRLSIQAVWSAGQVTGSLVVEDGDDVAVAAGTATWTFANGAFDASMVGGSFTVTGAAEAGNNATFVITAVNSATEIETDDGTAVTETFVGAGMTFSYTYDGDGDITGTFAVAVSNSYIPNPDSSQPAVRDGAWTDVTARIDDIDDPAGTAGNTDIDCGFVSQCFVRVTLTPAAGGGLVDFYASGKAYNR
jgi:hypothetical protein